MMLHKSFVGCLSCYLNENVDVKICFDIDIVQASGLIVIQSGYSLFPIDPKRVWTRESGKSLKLKITADRWE